MLSQREHSRAELYRKLQTRFGNSTHLRPLLDGLEEQGYLSDERFLQEYLTVRKRRGFGPLRIKAELRERGVDDELILKYLDDQDSDWYGVLQQAAASKSGVAGCSRKAQQKLARFLEYRGFPLSMIRRYLWDS